MRVILILLAYFLSQNPAEARPWPACEDNASTSSFLLISDFTSTRILESTGSSTQMVLKELLGQSLLHKNSRGEFESAFFSSWTMNPEATRFEFSVHPSFQDESSIQRIEKSLRETLFNNSLVPGKLEVNAKSQKILIESSSPRPRLFNFLTQIFPLRSDDPAEFLAPGPYSILCEKHDGVVLRLKRQKKETGRPELVDISTDMLDYHKASLVISRSFTDEFNGVFDNHIAQHWHSLHYLALNPKAKLAQSKDFRQLLACSIDRQKLIAAQRSGRLQHDFYSLNAEPCDRKALLRKIPSKLRKQAYAITTGQKQAYFPSLEADLGKLGIPLILTDKPNPSTEIGQIKSLPIFNLEPGLSVKGLCKDLEDQLPSCKDGSLRDKILAHKGQDLAALSRVLFEERYLIPLFYVPYTFLSRKGVVDDFEESSTKLINFEAMTFSPQAP